MIFAPTDSQKVFAHPDRLAAWLRDGRSFPVTLEIDATNACNHACSFCCWSVLHDQQRDTMSAELLTKIVDNAARVGVKGLIWTGGGEPLVNKNTPAAIERAHAAGIKNGMFTNGALVSPQNVGTLVRCCEWIRFSLAAGTRSEYQRIQGLDDFEKVKESIALTVQTAREQKSPVRLGATMLLHKSSLHTFLPFVELCRDLDLDFAQGKPNNNYDHEERSTYILERNLRLRQNAGDADAELQSHSDDYDPAWWQAEALPVLERARQLATDSFQVVTSQYSAMQDDNLAGADDGAQDCDVNNFVTAITASGNVVWCKHYRDRPEFVIGNVREQTLEEIWGSQRRAEVQAMIDSRSCAHFCQNKKLVRLLRAVRTPDASVHPDFL